MLTPGQWRLLSCEADPRCGRYDSAHLCSIDCPQGIGICFRPPDGFYGFAPMELQRLLTALFAGMPQE